ncbi:MAG: flagellar biosynthesis protein FlhA [Deltaproteobacteria bacterium]|nr:flagellar biosynthesis protein FlhA [Deltaproteobacteria bacterium]
MAETREVEIHGHPTFGLPVSSLIKSRETMLGFGLIAVVLVMMIPLPAFMLDLMLVLSLASSLVIFLIAIYTVKPIDFTIFPTVLLMVTIFRLALNIASTRLILTHGGTGSDAAGQIIQTFGSFVIGGNYVVGIIVFIILVVINFIVITKGAGRIAEVAARFTLDGMPGKQMAIDADLNAGLIDEDGARARRKEIETEADFYGSMDGSSKFVRGDAIAGIIITIVNIVAGLIIGVLQNGQNIMQAAQNYTILTVGEGLVAQIPALIVSTAAGIIVTKANTSGKMSDEVHKQVFMQPQAFLVAALVLGVGALHPSMPTIPFAIAAAVLFYMASKAKKQVDQDIAQKTADEMQKKMAAGVEKPQEFDPTSWVSPVDLLELEVGYGLVALVDERQNGDLLKRMTHLRRQFAQEMGFVVPPIHIRDNLQLRQGEYAVLVRGVRVGGGELFCDQFLAIDPGTTSGKIEGGIDTKEPAYGLPAFWITEDKKERAQLLGYTVVDNSTTLATHISEIIKSHSADLLGRQELQKLLDKLRETHPKVIEELTPELISVGQVLRVLKNLLREGIPVRDLPTILETIEDYASRTKDPDVLTEHVREALAATITQAFSQDAKLKVLVLDPDLDEAISRSLIKTEDGVQITLDPKRALAMINSLQDECQRLADEGIQPVVLTSPSVRLYFKKLIERQVQNCAVISHSEVTALSKLESLGVVKVS